MADDLVASGLEVAIITGGDPLAKRKVALPLIEHLQGLGVFVTVNTSGAQFTSPSLLEALTATYPDLLVFSIDSSVAEQHDESRVRRGLFELIVSTISALKLRGNFPIGTRTVITKQNYRQIPDIISKFAGLGVDCMKFTHIENDRTGDYLLSSAELADFNVNVRPRVLEVLHGCTFENTELHDDAIAKFGGLLRESGGVTYEDLSKGIFAPEMVGRAGCPIVERFSVIQSNGQVLPCCESEHHYSPVLGNLATTPAAEIFSSPRYLKLLDNRQSYCVHCTEPHNMQVSFKSCTLKVTQR